MAEKTLVEIVLDMFDGKTSVDETAARMCEAFYGRPCSAEEAKEAMGMTMTDNEKKLAFLLATSPHLAAVHGRTYEEAASDLSANGVLVREKGEWKPVKYNAHCSCGKATAHITMNVKFATECLMHSRIGLTSAPTAEQT